MTPDLQRQKLERARVAWGGIPAGQDYWEDFTTAPRGWIADSRTPLTVSEEGARCEGPWILDANHAPPGAGYLHLVMHIHTIEERLHAPYAREANMYPDDFIAGKKHAFIHGGHPRNFTGARIRARIRGALESRGARLTILVQGQPDAKGLRANWVLTGQSFSVGSDWEDQEVILSADPSQWTFLGSRHDLVDLYGYAPIEAVLADVNVSFIFILYPVLVEPEQPVADKHLAWADKDYTARRDLLPAGSLQFDYVWFHYV
jgi:hypothetical protein